jgi:tetratricopeptide (TPR) repeat protein
MRNAIFLLISFLFLSVAYAQTANDKTFLRWVADKKTAYPGEALSLQLKLYYEKSVSSPDIFPRLVVANGWTQEVKHKPAPSEERLNGKTYGVVTLKKYVVIPQKTGSLTIPEYPLTIRVSVPPKPDDFFQVEQTVNQTLTTPALSLQIVSLPEPKPATFAGAVGKFTWQVTAAKDSLHVQTSNQLTFQIAGTGNIPFLALPALTLPSGLEGFEVKSIDEQKVTERGVAGSRTFTQTIVGSQAGKYALPFNFTYFDPARKTYVTLTDSVWLHVTDTTQNSISAKVKTPTLPAVANAPGWYAEVPGFRKQSGFFNTFFFWVLAGLPVALCLAAWGWVSWKRARRQSVRWPYRQAMQALQQLKHQKLSLNEQAKALEDILLGYMAARYGLSTADWYAASIQRTLEQHSVNQYVNQRFLSVLQCCQQVRFAGSAIQPTLVTSDEIVPLLREIEKQSREPARSTQWASQVLGCIGLLFWASVWAAVPETSYQQARNYYQQQNFDSSAAILDRLVAQGYTEVPVYINLAHSYWQLGKTGLAILNYEKARRLGPAEPQLLAHLKTIRQKHNLVTAPETPWIQWTSRISIDALAWSSLALLWIGGVWVLARILFFRKRRWAIAWVCGSLAMTGIVLASLMYVSQRHRQEAIVITPATGYYAPSEQAREMVILPEGASVHVEDRFSGWAKVYISDGRRAWIRASQLKEI